MEGDQGKDEKLPPGFRFHPTDEELITSYLIKKISDPTFTGRAIGDVDLNKSEPWDLPAKAKMGEKEWYFFSLRDRKYPTGVRTNRATNTGYWKTTGKDKEIYSSESSELVGMKKTLVFYRGRAPRGEKTNWVMHEYRVHSKSSFRNTKDEWVVSRVFQKSAGGKKFPSNHHTRATGLNPNNITNPYYNFEMAQNVMPLPTQLMHHHHQQQQQQQAAEAAEAMAASMQFPYGSRNYMMMANNNNNMAEMGEMSRVLRTGPTSNGMNFPLPPQYNYNSAPGGSGGDGGGCFTISGLKLNLGGGATTSGQQLMRVIPPQQAILSQQELGGEDVGAVYGGAEEVNGGANGGGGAMYPCPADLGDNYWDSY